MAIESMKYCEYFNIDENYFPCIDESAINSGAAWDTTFPHETFINLLNSTEKMLGGITNRSIWIHGAYGTGKSQCAYALKKILEVPEADLRAYWNKYDGLRKNPVLLEKIIGHREQGILTAYRYASGSITTPRLLFFAVQESIKKALDARGVEYKGENSLKEGVISWLEDPAHNQLVNTLLQRPKWMSTFSQSSADEIINTLKKSSDVSSLMNNIFELAAAEGITALDLTADSLRNWILDIIQRNKIKIVLIWDEFSDFFRQNKNSLGEFQKVVSICQEAPFYFVVVTHPITSISSNDDSWKIVQQRFDKVEITLPDNIAFDLIRHAFDVKAAAKANWDKMVSDLNADVNSSRNAVMKAVGISNAEVMQGILPIHPIAALVLKNIASAFQSNQRSMFDFIKTPKDLEVKAFQWFIQNTSPLSDRPLLTVDMLWDFFYEKGKDYLSSDIKLILDTFPQQTQLNEKEKIVLKTILIMQAIDQRLGGSLAVLKPTDQNLSYAFEGDYDELENSCKSIAKALLDNMKSLRDEITNHNAEIREVINNQLGIFQEMYKPYLDGLSDVDCEDVKNSITSELFTATATQSNAIVKKAADDFRKNQVKAQLFKVWNERTGGTKNPRAWSEKHRTPILCCIPVSEYDKAKKVFSIMNSSTQSEADIKDSLAYIESAGFFADLASTSHRDSCFASAIVGEYIKLLPSIEHIRDELESTGISAYDWSESPNIKAKIRKMAEAEYNAGGSDAAVEIINGMDGEELKKWLTGAVINDMGLGVKIIINGGK